LKVIILAAGQGTRLGSYTKTKPKCLVELNGKSILDYQLELYKKEKLNDVIVITGYKQDKISNNGIKKIYNPNYKTTNMVTSLFCAEQYFDDDLIISYGDIIFSNLILTKLISSNKIFSVVVDLKWEKLWKIRMVDPLNDIESMKIKNGKIIELGKKVDDLKHIQGQYIGLIKIKKEFLNKMINFYYSLDQSELYDGYDFYNMYMTTFIQLIINHYNIVEPIYINGGWLEIDTISDLKKYERLEYVKQII